MASDELLDGFEMYLYLSLRFVFIFFLQRHPTYAIQNAKISIRIKTRQRLTRVSTFNRQLIYFRRGLKRENNRNNVVRRYWCYRTSWFSRG